MSNDLELRMRFTADNKDVVGKTRDTRQAVKGLTNDLSGLSGTARSTAGGMAATTTAGQEATRMFRLQKGALQQAGYQFQDLAVQIGSGTSAFVAIGQQGSQLLGILGPGGALLGAVLAIGSVIGGTLVTALGEGEDATKALDAAMKSLDETIEVNDGIPELTRQIRELARESEAAARARISSALLAAEDAAKSAARGIGEAFGELSIGEIFGLRDLEDFTESLGAFEAYLQAGYIQDELQELGELFGFSGKEAEKAGHEIGELLTRLRSNPSFENFAALEDALGRLSAEGGEPSQVITRLIGTLGTYFDAARDAGERTEALKAALKDLAGITEGEAVAAIDELIDKLRIQAETQGKSILEMVEYNRQMDLAAARDAEAGAEKISLINTYYDQIYQHEQATIAAKNEEKAQRELTRAQREYEQSVVALVNELDPLGAQFESVYEKQQLLIQAAAEGRISESYRDRLIANLVEGMADAGDEGGADFAEKVEKQMSAAGERVASSLQNAITSGDWDGIGASIGGALAGAIGGMVTDALTEQMAGQAAAGIFGPIAGAIAGGIAGLAVNKIGDWLSGDDWDPTEDRQARQGTGTVLGDINAKSESIRRAVESSEEGIGQLVGINQGMLRALQTLQLGIGGASAMVARQRAGIQFNTSDRYSQAQLAGGGLGLGIGGVTTGSFGPLFGIGSEIYGFLDDALGGILSDGMEFLDNLTGGLLSSIGSSVFGGDQKVVDEGIRIIGGNINDLVNRTLVQAYATIKEDGGWFSSDKRFDRFQNIATNQFSLAFESIYDAVEQSAGALGIDANQRLANFTVRTQRISLEDLSAAEQQAELEAYFSTVFDDLAGTAVPFLEDFQRAGEGLGETLARVANETMVTEEAVRRLELGFSDLSGRELVSASERLVQAAGGMEQFIGSMESFIGKFATETQQFDLASSDLTRALEQQGLAVPKTRREYWELLKAQNAATESGAKNTATLLRLQDVADDYYNYLEQSAEAATNAAEEAMTSLTNATDEAFNALRASIQSQQASLAEDYRAEQEAIRSETEARLTANQMALSAAQDGLSAIRQEMTALKGVTDSLKDSYQPIQDIRRTDALEMLREALATGDLTGVGEPAAIVGNINAQDYASRVEYERAQGQSLALLQALESEGGKQLTTAEQSVAALERQTDLIRKQGKEALDQAEDAYREEVDRLDQIITAADDRLNSLRGIETGVLSVVEAIEALGVALGQEVLGSRDGSSSQMDTVSQLYQTLLGREIGSEGQSYWSAMLKSGATIEDVEWAIRQSAEYKQQVHGSHAAGLGSVPFDGYRAELHRDEMVLPASIANHIRASMRPAPRQFDLAPVISAIERLEKRLVMAEAYQRQISSNTGKTATYQVRMDRNGIKVREPSV